MYIRICRYLKSPEEGVRSLGAGVAGDREKSLLMWVLGTKLRF